MTEMIFYHWQLTDGRVIAILTDVEQQLSCHSLHKIVANTKNKIMDLHAHSSELTDKSNFYRYDIDVLAANLNWYNDFFSGTFKSNIPKTPYVKTTRRLWWWKAVCKSLWICSLVAFACEILQYSCILLRQILIQCQVFRLLLCGTASLISTH